MYNLNDRYISYLIVSPEFSDYSQLENKLNVSKTYSILSAKNYNIAPMVGYTNGKYDENLLAQADISNDELRKDALLLISQTKKDNIIVKYKNENHLTKINSDGSEKLMELCIYDGRENKKIYIHNNTSFTLNEKHRYFLIKKKDDIKKGMVVEYFSNNKWHKKKVENVDTEFEKMYKLLIKYEKMRTIVS